MPMPLIPDMAVFQRKLATLPLATYQPGETVLSAASTTGRLLILKEGVVAVVKEGVEIARGTEPGAVFGELSVLLDQPHTADVRALEASQFHIADAATILRVDPIALLYVATILAQRLDSANRGPPRAEAPGSGRRAAQCNWENGREDRRTAGRQRCQSYVCRLSL
jgi:CRP/FNR family cyclic AMP-dependent transcriptional regulator